MNPAFEKLTGLKADHILGRTVREVLPAIEDHWIENFGRIAESGGTMRFENVSAELDRHYEVVAYQPKPGFFACTFTDITERLKLEEQLRRAQKMEAVGTLAGGIAHDFNNFLTGIMGYANLLRLESEPGDRIHKATDVIEKAAQQAASLAQQLLGFARRGKIQTRCVDLREVAADVVSILARTIDKKIVITERFGKTPAVVSGDPSQLQQVLMNLGLNAADAMPDGGEVVFEVRPVDVDTTHCKTHPEIEPGCHIVLSVSDTGTGIPVEIQDRIFEPFFTTKQRGHGTGMGLATSYGIVKNHGGSIQIYSEEGQGSTFKVYLPNVADMEAEPPPQTPLDNIHGGQGTVLVVDDEQTVLDVIEAQLTYLGYDPICVSSASEAVAIFRQRGADVDLVMIDWTMPEENGADCFQALKMIDPYVKTILTTGHAFNGLAQKLLDKGMTGFIQKPFVLRELAVVVADALNKPK